MSRSPRRGAADRPTPLRVGRGARLGALVAIGAALALAVAGCGTERPAATVARSSADLVLIGAHVYSVDPARSSAEAVAIKDGRITDVGAEPRVVAEAGRGADVIDLDGGMVLPGFQDPHLHMVEAGRNRRLCYLPPGRGVGAYERLARRCASEQSGRRWVRGSGPFAWDLIGAGRSTLEALDRAVPDRPLVITDALGHAAFANTEALRAAGLSDDSPDPAGGALVRDRRGRLTGVLLENAQNLVLDAAERRSASERRRNYRGLLAAIRRVNRAGITSVSDAGGYWPRDHHRAWLRALREDELTVRAANALWVYPHRRLRPQVRRIARLRRGGDPRLRFDQVKLYVDGIADYGTAALRRPYGSRPGWAPGGRRGFLYFEPGLLRRYVDAFARRGFGIHLHSWGDRAARLGLDALERARAADEESDRRDRLTHLYLVDDADLGRFAELDVFADLQLGPSVIDPRYARELRPAIGSERASRLLPLVSLREARADAVLSSDWDADPLSPLGTIERALTREGSPQRIPDLATALEMVTFDAARLIGRERQTGSIEAGKLADLVVLDRDLFELDPSDIDETRVLLTLLGGEEVYRAPGFAAEAG